MELTREEIREALYEADLSEGESDESEYPAKFDYSGRGMMGRECFAMYGDFGQALRFAMQLVKSHDVPEEVWNDTRTDQLGNERIVYWPSLTTKPPECECGGAGVVVDGAVGGGYRTCPASICVADGQEALVDHG